MTVTTTLASTGPTWSGLPDSYDDIIARAKLLRSRVSELGVEVDASGSDPTEAMRLLGEAGLQRGNVPVTYGGLWSGTDFAAWDKVVETALEITAGDGSTGQCWLTSGMQAREIFLSNLPTDTKESLADELLHSGRRIVASNAETGGKGPVTGVRVDGGIIVSGVKTFNTNSGGGGDDLANVGIRMAQADGSFTRSHALVRLNAPGVTLHGDWDNMGQRGTFSQTITYSDVFVADGWHYQTDATQINVLGAVFAGHSTLLQGIGEGAYDAALQYVGSLNRASMPLFKTASNDILMHRQLGEISSSLSAARAYLLAACRRLAESTGSAEERDDLVAEMLKVKVSSTAAGLDAAARLHDLTGARATANKYRLDRYWRNARTFASHDSLDAKMAIVGSYELNGVLPDLADYVPGVHKA